MSEQPQPQSGDTPGGISPARRVIGGILLVFGILLTVGAGLCTGVGTISMLADGNSGPELSGDGLWMIPLIFGGPFIVVGGLLWWGGKALRGKQPPTPPPPWTNAPRSEPPAS